MPIFRAPFLRSGRKSIVFAVPGEDVIRLTGTVIEVLKEATLYRVELKNGHRLLGFVTARRRSEAIGLKAGDMVSLQMTPCDFSQGRIILENERK